jgi:hypothetical protein
VICGNDTILKRSTLCFQPKVRSVPPIRSKWSASLDERLRTLGEPTNRIVETARGWRGLAHLEPAVAIDERFFAGLRSDSAASTAMQGELQGELIA